MEKLTKSISLALCAIMLALVLAGCSTAVDTADGGAPAPVEDIVEAPSE